MPKDTVIGTRQPRVFTIEVDVSGPLAGELNDWPANIQEGIYAALDRLAERERVPVAIVYSECERDFAHMDPFKDRWYINVVASEVFMGVDHRGVMH